MYYYKHFLVCPTTTFPPKTPPSKKITKFPSAASESETIRLEAAHQIVECVRRAPETGEYVVRGLLRTLEAESWDARVAAAISFGLLVDSEFTELVVPRTYGVGRKDELLRLESFIPSECVARGQPLGRRSMGDDAYRVELSVGGGKLALKRQREAVARVIGLEDEEAEELPGMVREGAVAGVVEDDDVEEGILQAGRVLDSEVEEEEEVAGVVLDVLLHRMFSGVWERRHGALCALEHVLKSERVCLTEAQGEDVVVRCTSVLVLDRFGDFGGDGVVAPVREVCARVLGVVVDRVFSGERARDCVRSLLEMVEMVDLPWDARHGALLALAAFGTGDVDVERVVRQLGAAEDEVRAAAARVLLGVVKRGLVVVGLEDVVRMAVSATLTCDDPAVVGPPMMAVVRAVFDHDGEEEELDADASRSSLLMIVALGVVLTGHHSVHARRAAHKLLADAICELAPSALAGTEEEGEEEDWESSLVGASAEAVRLVADVAVRGVVCDVDTLARKEAASVCVALRTVFQGGDGERDDSLLYDPDVDPSVPHWVCQRCCQSLIQAWSHAALVPDGSILVYANRVLRPVSLDSLVEYCITRALEGGMVLSTTAAGKDRVPSSSSSSDVLPADQADSILRALSKPPSETTSPEPTSKRRKREDDSDETTILANTLGAPATPLRRTALAAAIATIGLPFAKPLLQDLGKSWIETHPLYGVECAAALALAVSAHAPNQDHQSLFALPISETAVTHEAAKHIAQTHIVLAELFDNDLESTAEIALGRVVSLHRQEILVEHLQGAVSSTVHRGRHLINCILRSKPHSPLHDAANHTISLPPTSSTLAPLSSLAAESKRYHSAITTTTHPHSTAQHASPEPTSLQAAVAQFRANEAAANEAHREQALQEEIDAESTEVLRECSELELAHTLSRSYSILLLSLLNIRGPLEDGFGVSFRDHIRSGPAAMVEEVPGELELVVRVMQGMTLSTDEIMEILSDPNVEENTAGMLASLVLSRSTPESIVILVEEQRHDPIRLARIVCALPSVWKEDEDNDMALKSLPSNLVAAMVAVSGEGRVHPSFEKAFAGLARLGRSYQVCCADEMDQKFEEVADDRLGMLFGMRGLLEGATPDQIVPLGIILAPRVVASLAHGDERIRVAAGVLMQYVSGPLQLLSGSLRDEVTRVLRPEVLERSRELATGLGANIRTGAARDAQAVRRVASLVASSSIKDQHQSWASSTPTQTPSQPLPPPRPIEPAPEDPSVDLPEPVGTTLRPYQKDGVRWLLFLRKFGLSGILADDMGLGKTLQTLCALSTVPAPSLLICPASLVHHWQQQTQEFFPTMTSAIASSRSSLELLLEKDTLPNLTIISYSGLRNTIDLLQTIRWTYCIIDEGHVIRNPKTRTAQAVFSLAPHSQSRLILTGTPVHNHVQDLWSLFEFCLPGLLGNWDEFVHTISSPIKRSRSPNATPAQLEQASAALDSVHHRALPFILRRVKEDVLDDLPPKTITDVVCDLTDTQRKIYNDLTNSGAWKPLQDVSTKLFEDEKEENPSTTRTTSHTSKKSTKKSSSSKKASSGLASIRTLRLLCNHPRLLDEGNTDSFPVADSGKFLAFRDLLESSGMIGDEPGFLPQHRALVFSQTPRSLDALEISVLRPLLPRIQYLRFDGSVTAARRSAIADEFNTNASVSLLLLTTQVGSLGLNLTGADTVIFLDHDLNPQNDLQAMDRVHRIGQTRAVQVIRLIARNSLEEQIMGLQRFKLQLAAALVSQPGNASLEHRDGSTIAAALSRKI